MDRTLTAGRRRGHSRAALGAVLLGLLCALTPATLHAAPIQWRTKSVDYAADGKPLKEVLRDFSASQGLTISISQDVEGRVEGRFQLKPADFLSVLALSYGFVWYYDGVVLHVVSAKDIRNAVVRMTSARIERLRETVTRLRLDDPRFPIVYDEEENTAVIAGPQVYVESIRELAAHLESRTGKSGRARVRVFRLDYAWATDRQQGGTTLPGVASMLQTIYRESKLPDKRNGTAAIDALVDGGQSRAQKVVPLVRDGNPDGQDQARRAGGAASKGENLGRDEESEQLPSIIADASNNSIVIRDLPERMELHEQLIRSLDRRSPMIEIEVHVLDIEESALQEVGIDWTLSASHIDARTGNGQRASASYAGKLDWTLSGLTIGGMYSGNGLPAPGPTTPNGGLLTAVVGNAGQYLLARVAALETDGRARVSARPKVATLNNVSAVMDDQRTFHVRVAGFQSAQLYSVSAGTTLRVTPMTVMEADGYRIKLDVHVQDGRILPNQSVDGLPIVSSSSIGTQAFVRQGESLLLAGYAKESQGKSSNGIPFLSSLPMIGPLFRQDRDESQRRERLFLISPRVLAEAS